MNDLLAAEALQQAPEYLLAAQLCYEAGDDREGAAFLLKAMRALNLAKDIVAGRL